MANDAVIQVKNLSKTYHDGGLLSKRDIQALIDVSFDVPPGEVFGLLGPNGAGKTTFIKILLGIIHKNGGSAKMLGYPAGDRRSRVKVGYLPERLVVPPHHTGRTAIEFYGQLSGMKLAEVYARRDEVFELVGLAERADDWVRKYSKGMLQRLGLAQALIHNPQLLILDEPTDGLDPVGRSQVRAILARLRDEGKTIFLNSHLLQEVELICDRVAILDRGRLKRVGPVEEMTSGRGDKPEKKKKAVPVLEVELELAGNEDAIRRGLGKRPVDGWRQTSPDHFRLTTVLDNQAAVDACVDDLRAAGVSIGRLHPRRASLEDVFMEAVAVEEVDDE